MPSFQKSLIVEQFHGNYLNRLNSKFGISGTALNWFQSYLTGRTQSVLINGNKSQPSNLSCGVPPRFCAWTYPLFFVYCTIYIAFIADFRHHNLQFHLYADDTQLLLYVSFSTSNELELTEAVERIELCLTDLDKWMSINKLKLNKEKTEFLFFHSKFRLQHCLPSICFGQDTVQPCQTARNIGVTFDSTMSMLPHINTVCKSAFYHLRNLSRIRKFISTETAKTLVHGFISSKLDHCNSLLYNLPKYAVKKLQYVQKAAARLITFSSKFNHITPILKDLHWLPINECIKFKISILTFKALHDLSPSYIQELLSLHRPSRTLRSSSSLRLNPTSYNLTSYGSRAFAVASPQLWNDLPEHIKNSDNLQTFKTRLKTYLFKEIFV